MGIENTQYNGVLNVLWLFIAGSEVFVTARHFSPSPLALTGWVLLAIVGLGAPFVVNLRQKQKTIGGVLLYVPVMIITMLIALFPR